MYICSNIISCQILRYVFHNKTFGLFNTIDTILVGNIFPCFFYFSILTNLEKFILDIGNNVFKLIIWYRLQQIVLCPQAHSLLGILKFGITGIENTDNFRFICFHPLNQIKT